MSATENAISLARIAAKAASDVKATSGQAIDVSERLGLTDVFLIVSGSSERQVRAVVNAVEKALHEAGAKRQRREGNSGEVHWVLLDYDELVVHVMSDEDREFYALDKLWGDCPEIDLGVDFDSSAVAQANPLSAYALLNGED